MGGCGVPFFPSCCRSAHCSDDSSSGSAGAASAPGFSHPAGAPLGWARFGVAHTAGVVDSGTPTPSSSAALRNALGNPLVAALRDTTLRPTAALLGPRGAQPTNLAPRAAPARHLGYSPLHHTSPAPARGATASRRWYLESTQRWGGGGPERLIKGRQILKPRARAGWVAAEGLASTAI